MKIVYKAGKVSKKGEERKNTQLYKTPAESRLISELHYIQVNSNLLFAVFIVLVVKLFPTVVSRPIFNKTNGKLGIEDIHSPT